MKDRYRDNTVGPEHIPGARFRVFRSDFGSQYAVQGRGGNYIAAAFRSFLADPKCTISPEPDPAVAEMARLER